MHQIDFLPSHFSFQIYGSSYNKVSTSILTQSLRCQILFHSKFAAIVIAPKRLNVRTTLSIALNK